jgi:3-phosphoshikimate 1-carboxyvinyltransferase
MPSQAEPPATPTPGAVPLRAAPVDALAGVARVPGDKSISHRALLLGALAVGETRIDGLLEGEDVLATAAALGAMGVATTRDADGNGNVTWRVSGRGVGGLAPPDRVLDLGNSGTAVRLLMGVLAGHGFYSVVTGDDSLRRRPMARVTEPLGRMGARFWTREGGRLPISIQGRDQPLAIDYTLPVASAQVKSAVLLAGLSAPGETIVVEPQPTRDHSENMLRHFGATLDVATTDGNAPGGGRRITLTGQPELEARPVAVPADISSAVFPLVAAAALPGATVELPAVGINPLRAGALTTLREMGAGIALSDQRDAAGEAVATLVVRGGALDAVEVPAARAPSMIDEYPIVAVAAACARGRSTFHGLGELRVKESDRLAAIADGLAACGVAATIHGDSLSVEGCGGRPPGGGTVRTHYDHRIAMAFLVLGSLAERPVTVDDGRAIATSFPDFAALLNRLGGRIDQAAG